MATGLLQGVEVMMMLEDNPCVAVVVYMSRFDVTGLLVGGPSKALRLAKAISLSLYI